MMTFFRSMAGRVFLILVVGVLVSASLTWWLASNERQRAIAQFREARVIEQAEQFILTLDAIPAAGRPAFLGTARRFGLVAEEIRKPLPGQAVKTDASFAKALNERLGKDFPLVSLPAAQSQCLDILSHRKDANIAMIRGVCETVAVTLRDGSRVRVTLLPPRLPPPPRPESLIYLGLFLLSIGALAFVVSRMTVQPLKQLAQAAQSLGEDIERASLPQRGATEIRLATAAFNAMQARIRDHIRQYTYMLAAITHDLQTPLTRLRLRLEKVSDPNLREKLIEDLSQTQTIVREGLDLAHSMDSAEPLQPLDLDSVLDSICTDAVDAGQPVMLKGKVGLSVMARPTALRRCLTNLIDNAVKYGHFATVRTHKRTEGEITLIDVVVRDGGPGIAPEQLQKVFEPFYRIETSRSRETGGTGLGLTIARNIAKQHGGDITLVNLQEGGLEATLILPTRSVSA